MQRFSQTKKGEYPLSMSVNVKFADGEGPQAIAQGPEPGDCVYLIVD